MQFRDLKIQYENLKTDIDRSLSEVILESDFIIGRQVNELEEKLAKYVGRKYCITCANGTDALVLALMAMGVKKGDAVFVPDFTYIATASSVATVGATPIFVDIDLKTFNMSAESLENAINIVKNEGKLNLKTIIPVDLFGQSANYKKILNIAAKYDLKVIEDAAQGFGGSLDGKLNCSFGDIACTSFFPAKPLGCYGDGGAIFTNDENIDILLRSLRSNGKSPIDKYDNIRIGMNSRLDTLQASILLVKFKAFVDYELNAVNKVANMYTERLKDIVITPFVGKGFISSWAQYTILLNDTNERERISKILKEHDIPSMIYYPRGMHQQKCFFDLENIGIEYNNTIEATNRVLSLPIHPYLTEDVVDDICKIIINIRR